MNTLRTFAICIAFAVATPALAQQGGLPDRAQMQAQIAERVGGLAERLQLSDDQRARAEPILRASMQQRADMLERARADGQLSMREKLSLRRDTQAERERMMAQLEGVLTPGQLSELRRIQDEQRAELRAQYGQAR